MRVVLMATLALAACGQPEAPADFHETFARSATEACVATARARGAAPEKVDAYCACFVGEFRDLTAAQKMALESDRARLDAAAGKCRAKVFGAAPA